MANYIHKSIEQIASLDIDEIAAHPIGEIIGSGSGYSTYTLCSSGGIDIGLKIPITPTQSGGQITTRVQGELSTAAFLTELAPELEPLLPAFMGLIAVKTKVDATPVAMITEDVSQGKKLEVWSQRLSKETHQLLSERYAHFGPFYDIFDEEVLRRTVSFDAGGKERLLDFTPPPFRFEHYLKLPGYDTAFEQAFDTRPGWTIELPAESPLARSLVD